MLYPIDYTSAQSMITSLKAAFASAGVLETTHYEDVDDLIVKLTRNARVFKFHTDGYKRWYVYYGTSYTGGSNIADSITLLTTSGTGKSGSLVVTSDILVLADHRDVTITSDVLIGNMNNIDGTEIAWGWRSDSNTPLLQNTVGRTSMSVNIYPKRLLSTDNKYYMSDVICMDSAYTLTSIGVKGIKALHKGANYSAPYEIVGNDVVVPGGGANSDDYAIPNSLYIPGGAV